MKKITLFPYGGLGNRMRTVASAVALAEKAHARVKIVWYAKQDLNARFDALFEPICSEHITLKERSHLRYRLQKWLLPRTVRQMFYGKSFYEIEHLSPDEVAASNYISSCYDFHPYDAVLLCALFRPSRKLQEQIDKELLQFNDRTIGVHIRRTDHVDAINNSPSELFIEKMKEEIAKDPTTKFYLATDSEQDKQQMISTFGKRIITNPRKAQRDRVQGMQDALTEMFLLSKTRFILGSFQSTFSEMAAQIGNIRCEYLHKNAL